jgi:hypothetical protein
MNRGKSLSFLLCLLQLFLIPRASNAFEPDTHAAIRQRANSRDIILILVRAVFLELSACRIGLRGVPKPSLRLESRLQITADLRFAK